MSFLDNVRGLVGGGKRIGVELGRYVAAVELKGDPGTIMAAGHSGHAGYSGGELGAWMRRWMDTIGLTAKAARAVITEGEVHHYLVDMPEMSDSERHLAAGAEIRKLASVPASQLAYAHLAVGKIDKAGTVRDKVLIAAVDKSTLRNTSEALAAADLEATTITTVPAALIQSAQLLSGASGNLAIAWLSAGRSYLVVFRDGTVDLVRDFMLRTPAEAEPNQVAEAIGAEIRRSLMYFSQHAHGASVDRLVLCGPMQGMAATVAPLRQSLAMAVDLFDAAGQLDLGSHVEEGDQPALATALGAAMLKGSAAANLVPPEDITEGYYRRFVTGGRIAAALVMVLLVGWGALTFLSNQVQSRRLEALRTQAQTAQAELSQAQAAQQSRIAHAARVALLENRALESSLIGALLQRVAQRVPEHVVLESIEWTREAGPRGEPYWNAQLNGYVLGETRSQSQAIFNRFYGLLVNDTIVHDMHLVEPLTIGNEEARTPPPLTSAVRESIGRGPQIVNRDATVAGRDEQRQPGEILVRTSLDDLPEFGPTETSVGFKLAVQLKAIGTGGGR